MKLILPEKFYRKLNYDLCPATVFFGEQIPLVPRINLERGKEIGYADLYVNPRYTGQFHGSGRHLLVGNQVVKGAGLSMVENKKLTHHNDGKLSKEEAVREFVMAQHLKYTSFISKYISIGMYDEDHYFIIRDGTIPRVAQINKLEMNEADVENLKSILGESTPLDIIKNSVINLLSLFNLNLSHHSINIHNINILGQYLDLTSMKGIQNQSCISFWSHGSQMNRLREVIDAIIEVHNFLFKVEIQLEDILTDIKLDRPAGLILDALKLNDHEKEIRFFSEVGQVYLSGDITHYLLDSEYQQTIELSMLVFQKKMNMDMSMFESFLLEIRKA